MKKRTHKLCIRLAVNIKYQEIKFKRWSRLHPESNPSFKVLFFGAGHDWWIETWPISQRPYPKGLSVFQKHQGTKERAFMVFIASLSGRYEDVGHATMLGGTLLNEHTSVCLTHSIIIIAEPVSTFGFYFLEAMYIYKKSNHNAKFVMPTNYIIRLNGY